MRIAGPALLATLVMLALFWLMQWMIRPPEEPPVVERRFEGVELVRVEPEQPERPQEISPTDEPPPPPGAPPPLARPNLPSVPVPQVAAPAPKVAVPLSLSGGQRITGAGFGGFARGAGSGSEGFGRGKGFKGRELVPLSTARPQMPQWACEKGIRGWVEVVFTVMPNGRVQNVRIVDAQPRGVYEAAAIESISNWIYEPTGKAREVKQRVPMNPEDCQFNWRASP